jgi:hypothetical protein
MGERSRYDISDTDRVPPHVRLCHKILRESLAEGVTTVEFVGAGSLPVVNRELASTWEPYMQIPAPGFAALVGQLRLMAVVAAEPTPGAGTIRVRSAGRDADIALTAQRTSDGVELLTLRLPAMPLVTSAAT